LFSPGGPSFDGYANYEKRGEQFIKVVEELR
jgi:UDP-N-acetylmuramoylalanine-D-glutamate ligase